MFFPKLLATITQHPRQIIIAGVDFQWNPNNWSYNVFRLWEVLFGRRCGENGAGDTIRWEATGGRKLDGKFVMVFGTREALVVHLEVLLRQWFKSRFRLGFKIVPMPQYAFVGGGSIQMIPIFNFAIANDTAASVATDGASSPTTGAYTVTGSNPCLFVHSENDIANTTDESAASYNSVAMTKLSATSQVNRSVYLWGLTACATGSNTVSVTNGGVPRTIEIAATSYSGVKQTGLPDSTNSGTIAGTSLTVSTTVIATNCWLIGATTVSNPTETSTGLAVGSGTFARWFGPTSTTKTYGGSVDSNGTVGTGSQSLIITLSSSGGLNMAMASFAPATGGGGTALPFRSLLGVGI